MFSQEAQGSKVGGDPAKLNAIPVAMSKESLTPVANGERHYPPTRRSG